MDYFITAKSGGTPYGMYRQALRELNARFDALEKSYFDEQKLEVDIDELKDRTAPNQPCCDIYQDRRDRIALEEKTCQLEELLIRREDILREFTRFYQQACILKEQVGELTPARRAELDREYWAHQLKCTAAVDIMTSGNLRSNTIENLAALPPEFRAPIFHALQTNQLVPWFKSYQPVVPKIGPCNGTGTNGDIRRLLSCH